MCEEESVYLDRSYQQVVYGWAADKPSHSVLLPSPLVISAFLKSSVYCKHNKFYIPVLLCWHKLSMTLPLVTSMHCHHTTANFDVLGSSTKEREAEREGGRGKERDFSLPLSFTLLFMFSGTELNIICRSRWPLSWDDWIRHWKIYKH